MLTANVRFEGWSPTEWSRFLSLFRAPRRDDPTSSVDERSVHGGLVLVHDGARLRKAIHTSSGRIDPRLLSWPRPLNELAADAKATWACAIHHGTLEELMERFGARARREHDILDHGLLLLGGIRELIDEGALDLWPHKLKGMPLPKRRPLDRAIDTVFSEGRSGVLALYDKGELWTALILRRAHGSPVRFDIVAGPDALRREMGVLSGDFRRDYRHLVDAVDALYAPIAVGLHAEVDVFRALISSAHPGDWARAVALRDIVLSPLPPMLTLPIGVDAMRGLFGFASRAARQLDRTGFVRPILQLVETSLPALPAPGARQGFDVLGAIRRFLKAPDVASDDM